VAVPPDELVDRLTRDFESSVDTLSRLLKEDIAPDTVDYIFNINGYQDIIGKASDLIRRAEQSLELSLWGNEISELRNDIDDAVSRGVHVRLLSFNGAYIEGVETHCHRPLAENESSGRWITVVMDKSEALTGQCSGEGAIVAAWTRNRCLVFISGKYIEHEIIKIRESQYNQRMK
jgi:sugar-specific transcriptional regulator TrmB